MASAAGKKVTSPATPNRLPASATAPKDDRAGHRPGTPAASDQPATGARTRTHVGNSSLDTGQVTVSLAPVPG